MLGLGSVTECNWFAQHGEDPEAYSRRSRRAAVLHDQGMGVQE
jgi:hypothetical protein